MLLPTLLLTFSRAKENAATAGTSTLHHLRFVLTTREAALPGPKSIYRCFRLEHFLIKATTWYINGKLPKVPERNEHIFLIRML